MITEEAQTLPARHAVLRYTILQGTPKQSSAVPDIECFRQKITATCLSVGLPCVVSREDTVF